MIIKRSEKINVDSNTLSSQNASRRCNVGHAIGKELWEHPQVPNHIPDPNDDFKIRTGMVLAIEPMINMGKKDVIFKDDGWTCITKDNLPSAHFEHTVAITIIKARKAHKDILKNLYVYYRYDLFLHTENDDSLALNKYGIVYGRKYRTHDSAMAEYNEIFNYPKKMFVYLMSVGKIPVGFAIILKPSAINKKVDCKLEEFFIVNRYRKKGFGEHVFCELIAKHKGMWVLGILKENKTAITFWRKVITRNIGDYKKVIIPEDRKNDIPETVGFEFFST